MNIENLSKKYNRARAYESVIKAEGWPLVADDIRTLAKQVGQYAVYPGYRAELEHDKILEARGLLRILDQIENVAGKKEHLEKQLKDLGIVVE